MLVASAFPPHIWICEIFASLLMICAGQCRANCLMTWSKLKLHLTENFLKLLNAFSVIASILLIGCNKIVGYVWQSNVYKM